MANKNESGGKIFHSIYGAAIKGFNQLQRVGKGIYRPIGSSSRSKSMRISGSENLNIDPVYIEVSLSAQAREEYESMKQIVTLSQRGYTLTEYQINKIHESMKKIIELGKRAKDEYAVRNDKLSREDLGNIIPIMKYAKAAERIAEIRYILESDEQDAVDRRFYLSSWAQEDSKKKEYLNNKIQDIDVRVYDISDILGEDR